MACPGGCLGCSSTPLASGLHTLLTGSVAAAFSKSSYRQPSLPFQSVYFLLQAANTSQSRPPQMTRRRFQLTTKEFKGQLARMRRTMNYCMRACVRVHVKMSIFHKKVDTTAVSLRSSVNETQWLVQGVLRLQ